MGDSETVDEPQGFVARDDPQLTAECARAANAFLKRVDESPVFSRNPHDDIPIGDRDKLREFSVEIGRPDPNGIPEVTITAQFDFIAPPRIDAAIFDPTDGTGFGYDLIDFEYRYRTVEHDHRERGPRQTEEVIEVEFTQKLTSVPETEHNDRSVPMED